MQYSSLDTKDTRNREGETAVSEKVLGILKAGKPASGGYKYKTLFLTPDRVIVARTGKSRMVIAGTLFGAVGAGIEATVTARKAKKKEKETLELPVEDILRADKNNYFLSNLEIKEIELKKGGWGRLIGLNIITSRKKHKWGVRGLVPEKKGVKLEDYENMLRPIFKDRLIVKK
jgi:hypothetical protein